MPRNIKNLFQNALANLELGYRIIRGIDYATLSQYILKINRYNDIDAILKEVAHCLKEILDYELFGFALKNNDSMEIWIDPRAYGTSLADYVEKDFGSQKIDQNFHYFENKSGESSHNYDVSDLNNLISYRISEGRYAARLYILPRKKMLHHHDGIISTIVSSVNIALEKQLNIRQLEHAAAVDPLTNCFNRRALDRFIENDVFYARRQGCDLSIIMFDLDDFKEINDRFGHSAGDEVLREIALLVRTMVRKSDYVARYGGEEFVLVLRDTKLYDAVQLAHKIRKLVENHPIGLGPRILKVTASFGVASLEAKDKGKSLLLEADERLYAAKNSGKNSVVPSLLPCFADRNFVGGRSVSRHSMSSAPSR